MGANLIFASIVAFTGSLDIFVLGWPLQILVVGLAFAYVMFATRWLWVMIPTTVLMITGIISSYYWFIDRGNWTIWMLIAPVAVGTIIVTVILYVYNRKLASQVAYYTGLILMILTGTAIFGGTMYLLTNPEAIRQLPYSGIIDRAIQQGLDQGLKNVPNIPALKNLLTPTP